MIQKYSIWRVLRVFFDDPATREGFTIRYISRTISLAPTSVRNHLRELSRHDLKGYPLVIKRRGISYPVYMPNRSSDLFRFYKKMDMIFRIEESGLLEELHNTCSPKSIILFGSASRGEDVKGSDIDLFLGCDEVKLELGMYEDALQRRIGPLFSSDLSGLPKVLKNNILNGIVLKGYVKVF